MLKVALAAVIFSLCGIYAAKYYVPNSNGAVFGVVIPFAAACGLILGPRSPRAALWILAIAVWYISLLAAQLLVFIPIASRVYPPFDNFEPVAIAGGIGGYCLMRIRNIAMQRDDGLRTGAIVGALAGLSFAPWVEAMRNVNSPPTPAQLLSLTRAFGIWQGVVGTYLAMSTWWPTFNQRKYLHSSGQTKIM